MVDHALRIVLVAAAFIQVSVGLIYARKAGAGASLFRRRGEGILLTLPLAGTYLAYGVGVVAYIIQPTWMAWSSFRAPPTVRWLGAGALIAGLALTVWSLRHLGTNLTFAPATKDRHTLIISGPYGWVRHPLYTAFLAEAAGISLLTANWFIAFTAGACWLLLVYRTRTEESLLLEKFGDEYRAYMQRVGRFFPRAQS